MSGTKSSTESLNLRFGALSRSGQPAIDAEFSPLQNRFWVTKTDSRVGSENRSYKSKIRTGNQATTGAVGVKRSFAGEGPAFHCFGYVNGNSSPANARMGEIQSPSSIIWSAHASTPIQLEALNAARTRFAKKVEKTMTAFSGGVFLGELRETLHMIRNPAKVLRKKIGDYVDRCKSISGRARRLPVPQRERLIQSLWLEASFGWLPFLNDLDDARNFLQRRQDSLYRSIQTVKAKTEFSYLEFETPASAAATVAIVDYSLRCIRKSTVVLAGGIQANPNQVDFITASAMGLAPRSFVPTLWELLPWSFVADYFTNIGDVLQAWSNQHVVMTWGRETTIEESIVDCIGQRGRPNPSFPMIKIEQAFIPGRYRALRRNFVRTPIIDPPIPLLMFELPGFGLKWMNLAALATARRSIRFT